MNDIDAISYAGFASQIDAYKKAASGIADADIAKASGEGLEGEIHAGADHSKIIVRSVYEIPTEIIDPADMRS